MRLIRPSIEFMWCTPNPLQMIEAAGRTCYKSEDGITDESAAKFVSNLINRGHEAMIEHACLSYRVICDRGVTHEIVRHRLFSYAQESTRYCNYGKKDHIEFILPCFLDSEVEPGIFNFHDYEYLQGIADENGKEVEMYGTKHKGKGIPYKDWKWILQMLFAEACYLECLGLDPGSRKPYHVDDKYEKDDWSPQQARSVLPNALKTEIVITGNIREWRHFFALRTAKGVHPQMGEVARMILRDARDRIPVVFDHIGYTD